MFGIESKARRSAVSAASAHRAPRQDGIPLQRYDRLDALRGFAVVWMTAFHFAFDLNHFGWLHQDFYRAPVWTWQRTAIVSLFLICAGAGQAVAAASGQTWLRFWRRWWQVAGCAGLVTLGSWFMFPKSFIYFGVLHGIAVMLVVVRLTVGWGRWLWALAAILVAMQFIASEAHKSWASIDFLHQTSWNWLGLIVRKPITEDYVPVVPWLGAMWFGVAAAQWLLRRYPAVLAGSLARNAAPLSWLGRHSLSWYLLHQPLMIGAVWLTTLVIRG